MALRTDYKDFIPPAEGRKYSLTSNPDATTSIADVTQYDQVGDYWDAKVINATNAEVNSIPRYPVIDDDKERRIGWKLVNATNRLYKPLYEWYEDISSLPNAQEATVPFTKIKGASTLTFYRGVYGSSPLPDNGLAPVPLVSITPANQIAIIAATNTSVIIATGQDRRTQAARLWFRYTKTADATVPESEVYPQV